MAQKILMHGHGSVLLVRAFGSVPDLPYGGPYHRILLPLDGSERAELALSVVQSLARQGAEVVLARLVQAVFTDQREDAQRYLDRVAEPLRAMATSVRTEVREGHPLRSLHDLTEEVGVDLVIMTAHGLSGVSGWPLGRMAMNVATFGRTPLLLLQDGPGEQLLPAAYERAALERAGH